MAHRSSDYWRRHHQQKKRDKRQREHDRIVVKILARHPYITVERADQLATAEMARLDELRAMKLASRLPAKD